MAKIHPNALVESEDIGEGTCIWAFAHVMKGVRIGKNSSIGDHAFLETGSIVGNKDLGETTKTRFYPNFGSICI